MSKEKDNYSLLHRMLVEDDNSLELEVVLSFRKDCGIVCKSTDAGLSGVFVEVNPGKELSKTLGNALQHGCVILAVDGHPVSKKEEVNQIVSSAKNNEKQDSMSIKICVSKDADLSGFHMETLFRSYHVNRRDEKPLSTYPYSWNEPLSSKNAKGIVFNDTKIKSSENTKSFEAKKNDKRSINEAAFSSKNCKGSEKKSASEESNAIASKTPEGNSSAKGTKENAITDPDLDDFAEIKPKKVHVNFMLEMDDVDDDTELFRYPISEDAYKKSCCSCPELAAISYADTLKSKESFQVKDYLTLNHGEWVNDKVVDLWMDFLNEERDNLEIFSSLFAEQAKDKKTIRTSEVDKKKVSLLPIRTVDHWVLVVLMSTELIKNQAWWNEDWVCLYFDSCSHTNVSQYYFSEALVVVKKLIGDSVNPIRVGAAKQENGFDCGIYMLEFAYLVCKMTPTDLIQEATFANSSRFRFPPNVTTALRKNYQTVIENIYNWNMAQLEEKELPFVQEYQNQFNWDVEALVKSNCLGDDVDPDSLVDMDLGLGCDWTESTDPPVPGPCSADPKGWWRQHALMHMILLHRARNQRKCGDHDQEIKTELNYWQRMSEKNRNGILKFIKDPQHDLLLREALEFERKTSNEKSDTQKSKQRGKRHSNKKLAPGSKRVTRASRREALKAQNELPAIVSVGEEKKETDETETKEGKNGSAAATEAADASAFETTDTAEASKTNETETKKGKNGSAAAPPEAAYANTKTAEARKTNETETASETTANASKTNETETASETTCVEASKTKEGNGSATATGTTSAFEAAKASKAIEDKKNSAAATAIDSVAANGPCTEVKADKKASKKEKKERKEAKKRERAKETKKIKKRLKKLMELL